MTIPSSKEELVKAINSNLSLLNKELESITPQFAFKPLLEGHAKGTTISVANLASCLIDWGELVLYWHDQEARGKAIISPEEGFKWSELGCLAQKFCHDYEGTTEYEVLLARSEESKQQLVILIERFSSDELYSKPWYSKWTRGRMIQSNTASLYKNASGRPSRLQKRLAEQRDAYHLPPR